MLGNTSVKWSTKTEAETLEGRLEQELAQASPLRVHEALDPYAEYKATAIRSQHAALGYLEPRELHFGNPEQRRHQRREKLDQARQSRRTENRSRMAA